MGEEGLIFQSKNESFLNRIPPIDVRRTLRREVGFGCPVPGCGNPYLQWHHFDPPWRKKEHHDPNGMIALCVEHHAKADGGAYTKDQLRSFKQNAIANSGAIKGRFDWLRNNLLAVIGSGFYYETPRILVFRQEPVLWFNRDEEGYLLLNLRMLTTSQEPRALIEDNFWIVEGTPCDLESPPSGKLLRLEYHNGDYLRVEYFEIESMQQAAKRYPDAHTEVWNVELPITVVEIFFRVGGTEIEFGPRSTKLPGVVINNLFISRCGTGISFG